MNRIISRVVLVVVLLVLVVSLASAETKLWTGANSEGWGNKDNWLPTGAPTASDTLIIPDTLAIAPAKSPRITGSNDVAGTVMVRNGGKIRFTDNGKKLTVYGDFVVEPGGVVYFKKEYGSNSSSTLDLKGNFVNSGDFRAANGKVVFSGTTPQNITGTTTFETLTINNPSNVYVISGNVGVVGTYNPLNGTVIENGGTFNPSGPPIEPPLPISLAWFRASVNSTSAGVVVEWMTLSETDNYGFYVERKQSTASTYQIAGFVPTQGNGIVAHNYTFEDGTVGVGTWSYRLRQVDMTGGFELFESVVVEVHESAGLPLQAGLQQNYPNPFNPDTEIKFSVERMQRATVTVFNAVGQEVATLFDGMAEPGISYSVRFSGKGLASGVYFYRLQTDTRSDLRKMILLK